MAFAEMRGDPQKKGTPSFLLCDDVLYYSILLRLPVKSLLRFRCVCKAWRDLLKDDHFAHAYLLQSRLSGRRWFLTSNPRFDPTDPRASLPQKDYYLFPAHQEKPSLIREFGVDSRQDVCWTLLSSCNGLLLFIRCTLGRRRTFHVVNPFRRELFSLPKLSSNERLPDFTQIGFDPVSRRNKVIVTWMGSAKESHVFTLGVDRSRWRSIPAPYSYGVTYDSWLLRAPFTNGAIHWKYSNSQQSCGAKFDGLFRVASFDVHRETFRTMSSPEFGCSDDRTCPHHPEVFEFEGTLSFFHVDHSKTLMDVWVLADHAKEKWEKKFSMNSEFIYQWFPERSLHLHVEPFDSWDGEILLRARLHDYHHKGIRMIVAYHPQLKRLRRFDHENPLTPYTAITCEETLFACRGRFTKKGVIRERCGSL